MNISKVYKNLSFTALGAAAAMLGMLLTSLFAVNHITTQHFEFISAVDIYTKKLLESSGALKIILTFDNFFVVLYSAAFIFLFMALWHKEKSINIIVGLITLLATSLLDFYENHHIFTFITMAEKGVAINADDIANQMTLSQLKFHLSYLSFFLFAFSMPGDTFLERLLKYSLFFLQLPVGILVYTSPHNMKPVFEILRYSFMLVGLLLIAYNFYLRIQKKPV
jgi:hypothetical protein